MTDDAPRTTISMRTWFAMGSLVVATIVAAAIASGPPGPPRLNAPRSTARLASTACDLPQGPQARAALEAKRMRALPGLYGPKPGDPGALLAWTFGEDSLGAPGSSDPDATTARIAAFQATTGMRLRVGEPVACVDLDQDGARPDTFGSPFGSAACDELARQLERAWGPGSSLGRDVDGRSVLTRWTSARGRTVVLSRCTLRFYDTPKTLHWNDSEAAVVRQLDVVGKPVEQLFARLEPASSYSWDQVDEHGGLAGEREGEAHVSAHLERSSSSTQLVESLEVRGRIDARTWSTLRDRISRRLKQRPHRVRVTHDWTGPRGGWTCEGSRFTWSGALEVRVDFPCGAPAREPADYAVGIVISGAPQHPRDHEICDRPVADHQVCRPQR